MSIRHGMGKDEHDSEGRLITAEFPSLYVVNAYIPNSGDGLKRLDYRLQQWDVHFAEYLQQLSAKKPVVLTGDLNCAHQEIDIHAKKNLRSAGFTQVCVQKASHHTLQVFITHHIARASCNTMRYDVTDSASLQACHPQSQKLVSLLLACGLCCQHTLTNIVITYACQSLAGPGY